uniref:VIT domain-containing protein n=1 Tax=Dromaius novaehollandiae TaxID=8790 RepID=A0A8C4K2K6_DRONO
MPGLINRMTRCPLPLAASEVTSCVSGYALGLTASLTYANPEAQPFEGLFVYPLDECTTVVGFEAAVARRAVTVQIKAKTKIDDCCFDCCSLPDGRAHGGGGKRLWGILVNVGKKSRERGYGGGRERPPVVCRGIERACVEKLSLGTSGALVLLTVSDKCGGLTHFGKLRCLIQGWGGCRRAGEEHFVWLRCSTSSRCACLSVQGGSCWMRTWRGSFSWQTWARFLPCKACPSSSAPPLSCRRCPVGP